MPDANGRAVETVLRRGMDDGLHIGAQLHVEHRGRVAFQAALGHARPGAPMTHDSIMIWMSSGKPVAAVAIGQLVDKGLLRLDDRIARHLPAFAAHGKAPITVAHVLTHTGGFRAETYDWLTDDWDVVIAAICANRLEPRWEIGSTAGYHIETGWFILAELVRVIDGRAYPRYVRDEIFEPLGMAQSWVGMDPRAYASSATRRGQMVNTTTAPPAPIPQQATDAGYLRCNPGGNAHGPVHELARFYRMLLDGGTLDGRRILEPDTVRTLTRRHRVDTYDKTFAHVMDWGLGFMVNSAHHGEETVPYGFGRHAGRDAFGHGGAESSCGFADPAHDLVVCWVCNGMPGDDAHQARQREINRTIYEELGLHTS